MTDEELDKAIEEKLKTKEYGILESTRVFDSGASRHNDPDRIDWIRLLSLPVLFEYGTYMRQHRHLPDGSLRAFDNWKLGMPQAEIIESLVRHVLDLAALHEGVCPIRKCTTEEACCAIMFNVMAYLDNVLRKGEADKSKDETVIGTMDLSEGPDAPVVRS